MYLPRALVALIHLWNTKVEESNLPIEVTDHRQGQDNGQKRQKRHEDDDGEPTESFLESTLSAGVFTETRNQTFDLNFAFDIEAGDLGTGSSEIEIADPSLRLDYTLQNRDIRFDTDLIWREADVGNTFLPAAFNADDLVIDGGTQETQEARFRLETGRTARFGTTRRGS